MSRTQKPAGTARQVVPRRRNWLIWSGMGAVVAIAAIVAITTGGLPPATDNPTIPVIATGEALPPLTNTASDAAVGMPGPTLAGPSVTGDGSVEIAPDGMPMVIVFVAHWCPHCRAEVPRLVQLHAAGETEGVRLLAVATANDPSRPNYPASGWLESEGWPTPVLLDDESDTAASAYGVSGYPFITVLDGSGNVVIRTSGELGEAGLRQLFDLARSAG